MISWPAGLRVLSPAGAAANGVVIEQSGRRRLCVSLE
jgi:hypothetical protein